MAQSSPHQVTLGEEQRHALERRAAAYSGPHRDVVRAKAILLAADFEYRDRAATGVLAPSGVAVANTVLPGRYPGS
jgi:hypothetical protein